MVNRRRKLRRAERELASIHVKKLEAEKAAEALKAECSSTNPRVTLYQNNLRLVREAGMELNSQLDAAKVAMEAKTRRINMLNSTKSR